LGATHLTVNTLRHIAESGLPIRAREVSAQIWMPRPLRIMPATKPAMSTLFKKSGLPIRESVRNSEFPIVGRPRPGNILLATAVIFVLGKTVPAIHGTVFSGLERNFALLFAVRADSLMHLSRPPVVSSVLKRHILLLHKVDFFADIGFWLCE